MTNLDDVTALLASLDAQMDATNTAMQACSSLAASDLTSWNGFYEGWEAEKDKINSYFDAGWYNLGAKIDELVQASTFYGELQGYASQLKVWQQRLALACPNYQPPPSPVPPPPPPDPKNPTPDLTTYLKYGLYGLGALLGLAVLKTVADIVKD